MAVQEIHSCDWPGCTKLGTTIRDWSIQLPDYRWYCKEHVIFADAKQKRYNLERQLHYYEGLLQNQENEILRTQHRIIELKAEIEDHGQANQATD